MIILFCIVGIILNYMALASIVKKEPMGSMGLEAFYFTSLIPYTTTVIWIIDFAYRLVEKK